MLRARERATCMGAANAGVQRSGWRRRSGRCRWQRPAGAAAEGQSQAQARAADASEVAWEVARQEAEARGVQQCGEPLPIPVLKESAPGPPKLLPGRGFRKHFGPTYVGNRDMCYR